MKKIVKRFIAAVLAMVIMFTDCVNGFAVEMETECNEKAEIIEELSVEEPTHVLFEVEELREQSAKQYRLSDGTILAAQYGMDVHYEDESGKWKEIDNRFIYDSAVTTTDFDGYSTVEGAIGYKFAPSIQNGEILKVSDEKYSVGFELLAPSNVNQRSLTETNTLSLANAPLTFLDGEVLNEEEIPETMSLIEEDGIMTVSQISLESKNFNQTQSIESDKTERQPEVVWTEVSKSKLNTENVQLIESLKADRAVSSVGYANVFPGISLQYIMYGSSLKEYILVNQKYDSYSYDFRLNLENLTPEQQEDGSFRLVDTETGQAVYEIPAGYMSDAEGAVSTDVSMSIREYHPTTENQEREESSWILNVTADAKWINEEDRVFPVQIDPTLTNLLGYADTMRLSYVAEGKEDDYFLPAILFPVGYEPGEQETIAYIQLKNLLTIPKGSVICRASCYFDIVNSTINVNVDANRIQLHKVTENTTWNQKFKWRSKPAFSTEVMDYQTVYHLEGSYREWDITELVKEHYKKGNTSEQISAFAMKTYDSEKMDAYYRIKHNLSFTLYNDYPLIQISYRDTKGVEDYFTYQTHLAKNAGNVYLSDYTGQLTVINPVANYESTIQPYGLSLVYNSSYNNRYFSNDGTNIHTKDFSKMKIAAGWKLSAQETVTEVSLTDVTSSGGTTNWLVYNDADGTEHYFKRSDQTTGEYKDEDGLNLTITKEGNIFTMKDEKGNQKIFRNGFLTQIIDGNGNSIHIVYNNNSISSNIPQNNGQDRITAVYCHPNNEPSAKKIFTLTYNSYNYLINIKEEYGKSIQVDHVVKNSIAYLDKIRILKDTGYDISAKYKYEDGNCHLTNIIDGETFRGIHYQYVKTATGYRVNHFYEYTSNQNWEENLIGRKIGVTSDELQKTSYRDYGADNSSNTADDVITSYLFNGCGQTINANSKSSSDEILGVTAQVYTKNTGTSEKNNRVVNSIAGGQAGINLLKNGSFENYAQTETKLQATSWNYSGSGEAACNTTAPHHSGNAHYNLYNASDSDSKMIYQSVSLSAGKTYTASAYINTKGMSNEYTDGGAFIKVLNGNNEQIKAGTMLSRKIDDVIAGGWQRIFLTFTVPSTGTYKICVEWKNSRGVLRVDDVQLEEAEAASSFNFVSNGSFEDGTTDWTIAKSALESSEENAETKKYIHGTGVFSTQGKPTENYYAKQTIKLNKSSNTTFLLSGWSKADSVPGIEKENATSGEKYWGITLKLFYSDGQTETHLLPFAEYSTEWQYAAMAIVPKRNDQTIASAELTCRYYRNVNVARFDSISLTEEPCQTYKYNGEGEIASVQSTNNGEEEYSYSSTTQNLMEVVTEGSGDYTYEYKDDINKYLPTKVTNEKVSMNIEYNKFGEATKTKLTSSETPEYLQSSAGYSDGLLVNQTDNTGAAIQYKYNDRRKLYQTIRVTEDTEEPEKYSAKMYWDNTWNRITQIHQSKKMSLEYGYEKGRLTSILRGGYIPGDEVKKYQTYEFTYDDFGNRTSASFDGYPLLTYQYNNHNGTLKKMIYGEYGPEVNYTYDKLDRVKTVNYSGTNTTYGYRYSSDGHLAGITVNGEEKYHYTYDSLGRLIYSAKNSGNRAYLHTYHKYDTSDRIIRSSWQIGTDGFYKYHEYNSNDGTLKSIKFGDGDAIADNDDKLIYTYNKLKQISGKTSPNLQTDFTYRKIGDNRTTTQVQTITHKLKNGNAVGKTKNLNYIYDELGNIETVDDGNKITTYTYDTQNQLISEYSGDFSETVVYDTFGNIREKTNRYDDGFSTEHYTYYYNISFRKDQLSKLSYTDTEGVTTTQLLHYDSIGNPTRYYNGKEVWNFTWQNGKELASGSTLGTPGKSISNTYDADGIRETKTVGEVTHTYTTLSGKVVRESYGDFTIDYLYDDQGKPYKLIVDVNGTKYTGFYILNLQGDVIGIVDVNGVEAVTYEYDAWGKELGSHEAGDYGSILYDHNALKYRGYYFDKDLGMYYLNSRFYDAEIGRFLNADTINLVLDSQVTLTDKNLYAYCDNNPANRKDDNGQLWIAAAIGGGIAGGLIGALSYVCSNSMSGKEFQWGECIGAFATGAVNGALGSVAGIASLGTKLLLAGATGVISGYYTYYTMSGDTDNNDYKLSSALAAGTLATLGTMAGTTIDISGLKYYGMLIGNWAVTTCTGILTESVNIATQQHLQQIYEPVTNTNGKTTNETKKTTTYGGGGRRNYVCALY